jgi:membrane associated rhomboid family serine protease
VDGVSDVEHMREAFFRKTRRPVAALYVVCGIAAAALAAYTLGDDPATAALGLVVGFVVAVLLFAVSPLLPVSARGARWLVFGAPVVGIVAAQALDVGALGSETFFLAAFDGFLAGMVVGIAAIRRRLATDDDLLLRQKRLGFDPEDPGSFLRG